MNGKVWSHESDPDYIDYSGHFQVKLMHLEPRCRPNRRTESMSHHTIKYYVKTTVQPFSLQCPLVHYGSIIHRLSPSPWMCWLDVKYLTKRLLGG